MVNKEKKTKPTQAYVKDKIKKMEELKANAISPAQAETYEGYRQYWIGQLSDYGKAQLEKQHEKEIEEFKKIKEEEDRTETILATKAFEEKMRIAQEKAEAARAKRNAEILEAENQNPIKQRSTESIKKQIEELKKMLPKSETFYHQNDTSEVKTSEEEKRSEPETEDTADN